MLVKLKGLKKVTRRLATGETATYWYAWPGGPRLSGRPGSPAFVAAYQDAVKARKTPTAANLAALTVLYKQSPAYAALAPSTKHEWARWIDRVADLNALGGYSYDALDDRRVKADILDWRDRWAANPRTADYAMQVLSRVLAYGVERGLLAINAAAGVKRLYDVDRSEIIWTPQDLAAYAKAATSAEVGFIAPLACLTGLRRADLARLTWAHVGDIAIIMPTGKSGGRVTAQVPLLPETKALLEAIRARQALGKVRPLTVLATRHGKPWSPSGLTHAVAACGVGKHLHDCRGTFATRLRLAGLPAAKIAAVMGWKEAQVERLLEVYVDRQAVILDIARTLSGKRTGKRRVPPL